MDKMQLLTVQSVFAAESAVDNLDDEVSVKFIQEIMDWCGSHPVISKVSDTSRVYLCGHSRVWIATVFHAPLTFQSMQFALSS